MTKGFGGFLLLGGGCDCVEGAGCRGDAGPRFICLHIIMKLKILNSINNKGTLSFFSLSYV